MPEQPNLRQDLDHVAVASDSRAGKAEDHLARLLPDLGDTTPMIVLLFRDIAEMLNPPKLPPLVVTSRPVDPSEALQNISSEALEKSGFALFVSNLKEALFPPPQPPLELTSPPVPPEEIYGQVLPDDRSRPLPLAILAGLRDTLFPKKQPPLQLTSRPVPVRDIWVRSQYEVWAKGLSAFVHISVVLLAVFAAVKSDAVKPVSKTDVEIVALTEPPPYLPMPPKQQTMQGGGGGGDNSLLPASYGRLPRRSTRQFTPPTAVIKNENPLLAMEPTIVVPDDVPLPQVNVAQYGDPFSKVLGPPSNGPGSGGGIGSGKGGGVGSGEGAGVGPGRGGGFGGNVYRIGGGVSQPELIFKVEPEYSEEARKAKFQGTVRLAIVIDENGRVVDVRVIRPLGLGLDEKAIEAVKKWRFRPAMRNQQPVAVAANVEVNFRLL